MELREAIKTAARFTWKGKQASVLSSVRFLPEHERTPPRLFAHAGPEGVLINLDADVPNAMFEGAVLASVAKDGKGALSFTQAAERTWVLGGVHMDSGNVAEYPALPSFPTQYELAFDWWAVEQVLHAVSQDKQRRDLMCVHFSPSTVEATDRHRVARVFVEGTWKGLVPATLFKQWPEGDVFHAFTETMAVFQIGDQLRMASLGKGKFEDCDGVLPAAWYGPVMVVETDLLREAVKRVKDLVRNAKVNLSDLRFEHSPAGEPVITLMGGGFVHQQAATVHKAHDAMPVVLRVNPKWLYEALQQVMTPSVRLGFLGPADALRIDAGAFTAGIWPFVGD